MRGRTSGTVRRHVVQKKSSLSLCGAATWRAGLGPLRVIDCSLCGLQGSEANTHVLMGKKSRLEEAEQLARVPHRENIQGSLRKRLR